MAYKDPHSPEVKAKIAASCARYYAKNKQRFADSWKKWCKDNPERRKSQKRKDTLKHLPENLAKIKKWKKDNPERDLEQSRKYARENGKMFTRRIKAEMVAAYGGCCVCCGETGEAFLTIDHIHGRGHEHRRKEKLLGVAMYFWLKKNNWPKDNYQLLCFNCNCSKGLRGACPGHQEKRSLPEYEFNPIGLAC